jgi:hypothetical protein
MWPTEYMVHEHRKELQRVAAQVGLARQARQGDVQRTRRSRLQVLFAAIMASFRRPRRIPAAATECAGQPQITVLGRVN